MISRTVLVLLTISLGCMIPGCGDDSAPGDAGRDAERDADRSDVAVDDSGPVMDSGADASADDASASDGGTGDLFFASDWGTARGSSDEALSDGETWGEFRCSESQGRTDVLQVVDGSSVGFERTDNVLCFEHLNGTDGSGDALCGMVLARDLLPASTTFWARHYFRDDETMNVSNHPLTLHDADFQAILWARDGHPEGTHIKVGGNTGVEGYDPLATWFAGDPEAGGPPTWGRVQLSHATWYRFEIQVEFVSATEYRLHPRIHAPSGELLFDDATFVQNDYGDAGNETLASYYAAGNTFTADPELARTLALAQEGPFGNTHNPGERWYIADLAISLEGWIGE